MIVFFKINITYGHLQWIQHNEIKNKVMSYPPKHLGLFYCESGLT